MKIYLGIKYYADNSNKEIIENIFKRLVTLGHGPYCVAKDLERWGEASFSSSDLMQKTFEKIDDSDLVLIEFSEKGVGLGIEAGYAYSKGIPIQIIAKKNSEISNTMSGISSKITFYGSYDEITVS